LRRSARRACGTRTKHGQARFDRIQAVIDADGLDQSHDGDDRKGQQP
jgi:hypothetical protein